MAQLFKQGLLILAQVSPGIKPCMGLHSFSTESGGPSPSAPPSASSLAHALFFSLSQINK